MKNENENLRGLLDKAISVPTSNVVNFGALRSLIEVSIEKIDPTKLRKDQENTLKKLENVKNELLISTKTVDESCVNESSKITDNSDQASDRNAITSLVSKLSSTSIKPSKIETSKSYAGKHEQTNGNGSSNHTRVLTSNKIARRHSAEDVPQNEFGTSETSKSENVENEHIVSKATIDESNVNESSKIKDNSDHVSDKNAITSLVTKLSSTSTKPSKNGTSKSSAKTQEQTNEIASSSHKSVSTSIKTAGQRTVSKSETVKPETTGVNSINVSGKKKSNNRLADPARNSQYGKKDISADQAKITKYDGAKTLIDNPIERRTKDSRTLKETGSKYDSNSLKRAENGESTERFEAELPREKLKKSKPPASAKTGKMDFEPTIKLKRRLSGYESSRAEAKDAKHDVKESSEKEDNMSDVDSINESDKKPPNNSLAVSARNSKDGENNNLADQVKGTEYSEAKTTIDNPIERRTPNGSIKSAKEIENKNKIGISARVKCTPIGKFDI